MTASRWMTGDLYSHKHNEANGEDNHDGHGGEVCANFGVEGPSDDAAQQDDESSKRHKKKKVVNCYVA